MEAFRIEAPEWRDSASIAGVVSLYLDAGELSVGSVFSRSNGEFAAYIRAHDRVLGVFKTMEEAKQAVESALGVS